MSFSVTVGAFQYSYRFRFYFFTITWSALVEEEVEEGDSLSAVAALSVSVVWISSMVLEDWSSSVEWDILRKKIEGSS
jgi:hypothetical protein